MHFYLCFPLFHTFFLKKKKTNSVNDLCFMNCSVVYAFLSMI